VQQEGPARAGARRVRAAARRRLLAQEAEHGQAPVQVVVDGDDYKVAAKDVHALRRARRAQK